MRNYHALVVVASFMTCLRRVSGWVHVLSEVEGTVGGFRRTRYRTLDRTGLAGYLVATAYNLVRIARLLLRPPAEALPALST